MINQLDWKNKVNLKYILTVEEPNNGDKKINISDGDLALATYSNSESTLLAYISIFEILSGLKLI